MSDNARRCEDVVDRLVAALRTGGDVSDEDRRHVTGCAECQRVLAAAGRLEDELEADVPADGTEQRIARATREAEAAVRRQRARRVAFTLLGALAMLIPWLLVPKVWLLQVVGALVGLGAVGSLVADGLNRRAGGLKLYKRLKGQWIFGVCRGLAEASGLSVWVMRAAFILLLLVGKPGVAIGLFLYLLLDMSLEVHPEDRGQLLRFRFKRWLGRFSAAGGRPAVEASPRN
jgi:phage shock protein PspC (stress-responsive transcriptional regulator)